MDPKSYHNLPSESTTARETEDAIETSTCQIWIEEGATIPCKDVSRMRMEFHYAPYRSLQMKLQDMFLEQIEEPINCCIVYIRSFANSGHDFVYCVPGRTHLAKFYGGTYGARDYQGPVFAALVVLAGAVIEQVGPINWRNYRKVSKHMEKVNGVRWRYLFATARRAWSTMSFEASGVPILEAMVADVPVQQQPEPEARLPEAISSSKYPPEAQIIAIYQNVELLKKKPDHHDRILKYLEIELNGRSNVQGKDELTKQQYRLLGRLRDNADDFDILYLDEDENGNEIRNADVDKEEEAHLISERDAIVQQILEQLALPITMRDDLDDSDLPDAMEITGLETGLIQKFANFTGATPQQCERYLSIANWNIDLALSYFEEEQARSRPSVVRSTSTPGPKEIIERVTTFKALTNAESAVASNYLTEAGWNLSIAVTKFYDDAEAPENNSKSVVESPSNVLASKFSTKINEQPVRQIPPYSDATTRLPGERTTLDANLKASIQRRIAELDTEITQLDKELEQLDEDDLDMIMRDLDKREKISNKDGELYTGPRDKLHVVDEDPSPAVTRREGMSHAGLPCVLDEAGNVVSYKRPTGTPYQQYLDMCLRLQVQNYGHEIVASDEDPHRGIPTRERYPESLVQEVVSDSSDDTIIPPNGTDLPASQKFAEKTAQAERRRVAMKEMVELMNLITDSQNAEATRSMEEMNTADALAQLKNQQGSDWAEQVGKAIQHVKWQDIIVSDQIDQDNFLFGSEDEWNEDAVSTEDVNKEKPVRIKSALRDTTEPRKPSRRVRFSLINEERDAPTTRDEHSEDAEEKMPTRGRPILRGTRQSERLRMKSLANAAENGKDKLGTRGGHTNVSLGKEVKEKKTTLDPHAQGGKRKSKAQKKKDLFVSKREDAWDGLDGDEGELELGSDVDAEGEEEEVEEQRTGPVELQQGKHKWPPRIDEKMEDS